ncbi:MAG TPA: acetoacetate decarboxylase family protein [Amycolatopsis sp.]|nr:acetoacetate decarboxylase family protein [Amycolatopsis sp.]
MSVPDSSPRYEMPTVFGPSLIPVRSVWGRVEMVSISFTTTYDAARRLVPPGIDVVGEEPVVTFSRMSYSDVDYLAGGGYNEITVGIAASVAAEDGTVTGNFMPVVWVDEPVPIQIGRESLGYAKVHGELPEVGKTLERMEFALYERGTRLLRGSVSNLTALPPDRLTAIRRAGTDITVLGWKYVPGLDGVPDADYPTRIPLRFDWDDASTGEGSLTFDAPSWEAAPVGARMIEALRELPVVKTRRALVANGSGSIDRSAASRLSPRLVGSRRHAQ